MPVAPVEFGTVYEVDRPRPDCCLHAIADVADRRVKEHGIDSPPPPRAGVPLPVPISLLWAAVARRPATMPFHLYGGRLTTVLEIAHGAFGRPDQERENKRGVRVTHRGLKSPATFARPPGEEAATTALPTGGGRRARQSKMACPLNIGKRGRSAQLLSAMSGALASQLLPRPAFGAQRV